jgi:hypothetical protein
MPKTSRRYRARWPNGFCGVTVDLPLLYAARFATSTTGDDRELVVADEMLAPDSSRFWPADQWTPGTTPPSFDKQPVRDFLERDNPARTLYTASGFRVVEERESNVLMSWTHR